MRQTNAKFLGTALLCVGVLALLATGLGGCRGRTVEVAGTDVAAGGALYGRLPAGRQQQSFTFEGVESSLLDVDLVSDEPSLAAPQICLLTPEGKTIDLRPHTRSPDGAATTQIRDVVLLRTGTYQVTVAPTIPCEAVYYRFCHKLHFPPIECMPVTLSPCEPQPVYVSAPRGGLVTVKITPKPGTGVTPLFRGVEDPWGGRALDPNKQKCVAMPATVHEDCDGSVYLNFQATIPGRYKVMAIARDAQGGPAYVTTRVREAPAAPQAVWHPNRTPQDFGMPAAGSASDAGR